MSFPDKIVADFNVDYDQKSLWSEYRNHWRPSAPCYTHLYPTIMCTRCKKLMELIP